MSKSINVNPDHYKVAGRERPGHAIPKQSKEVMPDNEKMRAWSWQREQREGKRPKGKVKG